MRLSTLEPRVIGAAAFPGGIDTVFTPIFDIGATRSVDQKFSNYHLIGGEHNGKTFDVARQAEDHCLALDMDRVRDRLIAYWANPVEGTRPDLWCIPIVGPEGGVFPNHNHWVLKKP